MADKTEHYGLNLPAQADFYNVDEFNENAELIDQALNDLETGKVSKAGGVMTGPLETPSLTVDGKLGYIPVVKTYTPEGGTQGLDYAADIQGLSELYDGLIIEIIPHVTNNSNNAFLSVNGSGKVSILRTTSDQVGVSQFSVNGWMLEGVPFQIVYIMENWYLLNLQQPSAEDIDGIVPISKGGTGAPSAQMALVKLGAASKNHTHTADQVGASTWVTAEIPAGRMRGDIDGDGKFTQADYELLRGHTNGTQTLTDPVQLRCADINNDGVADFTDLTRLQHILTGLTKPGAYSSDITGNWTKNPNAVTEEGQFYADIPVDGMTAQCSAVVTVPGTYEESNFPTASCMDGALRIYAKYCPIASVPCVVEYGPGDGSAAVVQTGIDLSGKADADHTHTAAEMGALSKSGDVMTGSLGIGPSVILPPENASNSLAVGWCGAFNAVVMEVKEQLDSRTVIVNDASCGFTVGDELLIKAVDFGYRIYPMTVESLDMENNEITFTADVPGNVNIILYKLDSASNLFAAGEMSSAHAQNSAALGKGTTAAGSNSFASGYGTFACGDNSHTEGFGTKAKGNYAHSEGHTTKSEGMSSHSEGQRTLASGKCSHAEGYWTTASGIYSHAGGERTNATADNSTIIGKFGTTNEDTLFAVANGTSKSAESIALDVTADGTVKVQNNLTVSGKNVSLEGHTHTAAQVGSVPASGGTFTGAVSGVSPANGSTKGFRNIYYGSGIPVSSLGADGDIYIKIG